MDLADLFPEPPQKAPGFVEAPTRALDDFLPEEPIPGPPVPNGACLMPDILVRSLNQVPTAGWNYHPRSDRHSILKCAGLLLDLIRASNRLRQDLGEKTVVFGINSKVAGKALDLVVGVPGTWTGSQSPRTLGDILSQYNVCLTPEERLAAGSALDLREGSIVDPLIAVEAKAVMTDHGGALPRVSDELERFRLRVQDKAITAALVMVNAATHFTSPGRNGYNGVVRNVVSQHKQPSDALKVCSVLQGLPLRQNVGEVGFDAIGVVALNCQNDGTPITLVDLIGAEQEYGTLVRRLASRYS